MHSTVQLIRTHTLVQHASQLFNLCPVSRGLIGYQLIFNLPFMSVSGFFIHIHYGTEF